MNAGEKMQFAVEGSSLQGMVQSFKIKAVLHGTNSLFLSGQDESNIVRLLLATDPVAQRLHDLFRDKVKRLMAMAAHNLNQPVFAKFAKFIFRFGDSIAVCNQNVPRMQLLHTLVISCVLQKTDDGATATQCCHTVVGPQHQRWQLSSAGVGQLLRGSIVMREK